ncbi:MAG: GDP-L-fucose synthase [Hyphomonadaceae bacterium]
MTAPKYSLIGKRIFVAGHRGLVGSAIVRRLANEDCEVLTVDRHHVDLRDQFNTQKWIADHRPQVVVLAAAKVGGILANDTYPADFLFDNLAIATNVIDGSFRADVEKLLFLGSSCVYPRLAIQPISESALLTGPLESTNEWYAIAKIAGLKMCQAYRRQYGADYVSAMPANLYGPGDNYDLERSHVIPALLRRALEARNSSADVLPIWGSGAPRREFMHVDDAADALVHVLKAYSDDQHVNVGSGEDISIVELATMICDIVGFNGRIITDPTKPDGTPRKLMNNSKLQAMGWRPKYNLRNGIQHTYNWLVEHLKAGDARLDVV